MDNLGKDLGVRSTLNMRLTLILAGGVLQLGAIVLLFFWGPRGSCTLTILCTPLLVLLAFVPLRRAHRRSQAVATRGAGSVAMNAPALSKTRVRLLMCYCFALLMATQVVFYRAAHPVLWVVAFVGSIPIVAALVGGWPEPSDSAEANRSRQD